MSLPTADSNVKYEQRCRVNETREHTHTHTHAYIYIYKVHPRTGNEGPEGEQRYSSTLSLTSAIDLVGCQRHTPAALPPGKIRYPLYRRQGGTQGRSGRVRKISPPPGLDSQTVQPVASRYTGPPHSYIAILNRNKSIRVYYPPTNAQVTVIKTVLKFTLK